jgi:putative spermidine/putrescine transport system permease protein
MARLARPSRAAFYDAPFGTEVEPVRKQAIGRSGFSFDSAPIFIPAKLRRPSRTALQFAPVLILIGWFFVVPLLRAVWASFDGLSLNFDRYREIFTQPIYADVLLRTLAIAAWTTVACILLGYPLAYLLTTLRARAAALFSMCLLVPLFTAFLIRTYGWTVILGRQGILNKLLLSLGMVDAPLHILGTRTAVYIGLVHVLMPISVFILYAGMARIDRTLLTAASVLGANPVRAFTRVYLPMSLPAIVSACVLVFIMAAGFYITPALLGGPADTMISQLIVTQITTLLNRELGFALSVCLLVVTIAAILLSSVFVPVEQIWALRDGQASNGPASRLLRGRGGAAFRSALGRAFSRAENMAAAAFAQPKWLAPAMLRLYAALMVAFLLAPIVVVYVLSVNASPYLVFPPTGFSWRWYERFFSDPDWRSAFAQSLRLAATVATLSLAFGAGAAFGLVRGELRAKRALIVFVLGPLLVPVIVLSIGLYVSVADLGLLGSFTGLVIGHVVLTVPYATVVLVGAVGNLDRNIEYAAMTLGGSPMLVLRKVVVPVLSPALLTAWMMAFLQSFDELLVTLFLLGRQAATLPIKMWSDIRIQFDPTISAASSTLVTLVIIVVLASQMGKLVGRRPADEPSAQRSRR